MTPRQRSERKAALLARIEQQRAQLSLAAEGWLSATRNLDRGWQLLVRYRHLAMVGGVLLLRITSYNVCYTKLLRPACCC